MATMKENDFVFEGADRTPLRVVMVHDDGTAEVEWLDGKELRRKISRIADLSDRPPRIIN